LFPIYSFLSIWWKNSGYSYQRNLSENQETATFQIDEGKHNWVSCWNWWFDLPSLDV
jgi:hypothetical protein